ncbi:MAG: hypothetical protein WCJ30_03020 [Deltaproteobacteria bacterium]
MNPGFAPDAPDVTPRDAATVILLRDGADGLELFFVKRHADVRFMGGAYVFPGGKLEASDSDPRVPGDLDLEASAARLGDPEPARARGLHVAAIRECLEEAGVLFACESLTPEDVSSLRHACDVEKRSFLEILPPRGVSLRLSALVPFARWITPRQETRRFDARFFVAAVPEGVTAVHDTRETVESAWLSPTEALARASRDEILLVPPTYRTVQQLAAARTVAEVVAGAPSQLETRMPRVAFTGEGSPVVLLPDDPEHAAATHAASPSHDIDFRAEMATRFTFRDGGWRPGRCLIRS